MGGDVRRLAAGGAGLLRAGRSARRPARLRGPARPDEFLRRHGRRRHHLTAGARRYRPQLRLPLRLDPRPELRGPRGRRPRPARAARLRGALHHRTHPGRRRGPAPRVRRRRRTGPSGTRAALPRLPGGRGPGREPRGRAVPARRVRGGAPAVRRRGAPRPAHPRRRAGGRRRGRGGGAQLETARRGAVGTGRTVVDPVPAERGLRSAPDRRRASGTAGAARCRPRRGRVRRDPAALPARRRPLAPGRRRRRPGGRAADAARPRLPARRRPEQRGHPPLHRGRAGRGRLPLPLRPSRCPLGRGRGGVPALRVHHGAGHRPPRRPDRGAALVRTDPDGVRAGRAVRRGVRRAPAPAARQPAPGLRARPPAGVRRASQRRVDAARLTRRGRGCGRRGGGGRRTAGPVLSDGFPAGLGRARTATRRTACIRRPIRDMRMDERGSPAPGVTQRNGRKTSWASSPGS
ncbi:hypothetical protein SGPA1_41136 [Streptomyces misionensis JCM 4497]